MKIKNNKKLIVYITIIFIGLILVGLIGAIIRLINLPTIIITIILIVGFGYNKKSLWLKNILSSILHNEDEEKSLDLCQIKKQ